MATPPRIRCLSAITLLAACTSPAPPSDAAAPKCPEVAPAPAPPRAPAARVEPDPGAPANDDDAQNEEDALSEEIADRLEAVDVVELSSSTPLQLEDDGLQVTFDLFHAAEGDEPRVGVRVKVSKNDWPEPIVVERVTGMESCMLLYPGLRDLARDEEFLVLDAALECHNGSEMLNIHTEHTVVAIHRFDRSAVLLHAGESHVYDDRRVAVDATRTEYYVEGADLAVYRHDVAWCDREALRELLDEPNADCRRRKRTLKATDRVDIRSALRAVAKEN